VFWKVIQVNDEKNDANIVNMFCFTLKDAILEWGENFMQSPEMFFCRVKSSFCKQYQTMQTNNQVYMALYVIKQGVTEKVEVYYKRILKLANCLQHKANDNLLTIFFRVSLIPYLRVATLGIKHNNMFEHKEVAVTCEESMGNPTEYQKFLKPPKSDISNDGKCTNLVCSQCKKKGHNKQHCHWNSKTPNN